MTHKRVFTFDHHVKNMLRSMTDSIIELKCAKFGVSLHGSREDRIERLARVPNLPLNPAPDNADVDADYDSETDEWTEPIVKKMSEE